MRVLAAHADCLFRKPDMEIQAARKFAEATAVPPLGQMRKECEGVSDGLLVFLDHFRLYRRI